MGLSQVFLFGQQRDDLEVEVTQGSATVVLEYQNTAPVVYPTVGHMNVAYGDARYLFLVNSSPHLVEVHVRGLPRAEERSVACLFAPGDGELAGTKESDATSLRLALTPWQVRAYRISQAPNET